MCPPERTKVPEKAEDNSAKSSSILLPAVLERIAEHLTPNELACARSVNKEMAAHFREHTTLRLSQPLPHWAFRQHWSAPGACKHLTREQRDKLISLTAASDDVPNLEVALAAAGLSPAQCHAEAAAAAGAARTCRCLAIIESAVMAARTGHLSLAKYILRFTDTRDIDGVSARLFTGALEGCDLASVKDLYENLGGMKIWDEDLDELLAEWMLAQGVDLEADACSRDWHHAILSSRSLPTAAVLERFDWLKRRNVGPLPQGEHWAEAVRQGNSEALAWLLAEGAWPEDEGDLCNCSHMAAKKGHINVLEMLERAGRELNFFVVAKGAAIGGRIDVLEWIAEKLGWRRNPADLQPIYVGEAAAGGSTEAVRWLRELGCEWPRKDCTYDAWSSAVRSGCEAALEGLAELGAPLPHHGAPYATAVACREWGFLRTLHRLGVPQGPHHMGLFRQAAAGGAPLATLQWLMAQGPEAEGDGGAEAAYWQAVEAVAQEQEARVDADVRAWAAQQREKWQRARWRNLGRRR
ncbi:hypothetical protein HYH03_007746 [Edaphochlamys debaryana]|uniref:Ankyrin repeat domain-containing protein n=1 Tax=Edaphochlamys debaryana TaxID=47281 RepID=A0A835Y2P9_9CHLO|nr:hypothetical protein HYH03_007746 [Edaphochlamys debaryana]|eukprot:KAG2494107.1 hypothetical protein HYH03_007746 [Edaphochlamys debaryana]